MKRYNINKNFINFFCEEFDSISELIKTTSDRPVKDNIPVELVVSNNPSLRPWYGCTNLTEAQNLLQNGVESDITTEYAKIAPNLKSEKHFFKSDVIGFTPIVPNAIIGVPNSMLNRIKETIKDKIITIVYDAGISACVSKEEVIKRTKNLLKTILSLEKNGYHINLKVISIFVPKNYKNNKRLQCLLVNLKRSDENLNMKKLTFPLSNVAYERVIAFDWNDKSNNEFYENRGCPYYVGVNEGWYKNNMVCDFLGRNVKYLNFALCENEDNIKRIICG